MNWFQRLTRRRSMKIVSLQTWLNENPIYSGNSFEALVTHGWRKNELIFSCISKTANTAAQVELKFYQGRDGRELPNHPIKRLIQKPNSRMNEFDFWAAIIIYQKLAGVAYFEKERSAAGQVVALWPLRPDWLTAVPLEQRGDVRGKVGVAYYEYRVPGLPIEQLLPEDVVEFPLYDPLGMFNHWPPAAVAARTGDVDNAVTDYLRLFMQKGGTPPGLLTTVQHLIDTQVDDIRRRWRERYGGFENWMEPAVLDADAKWQQIGLSFKEMGFELIDARNEARICMTLQVPPILIGAKIGLDRATYSNYGEARTAWWEDDLLPMYASFEDVIINQIIPEFENGITAGWDFNRVNALQEDRNKRWQRATAALSAGGILVNEFRAEVGLSDMGPAGNMFLRSTATVEVPAETGVRETPEPITEIPENTGEDEDTEEEPEGETGGKSAKAKQPNDEQIRLRHEKAISKGMITFFDEQLGRVEKELKKVKAEPKLEFIRGNVTEVEVKLITSDILSVEWWAEEDNRLYKWLLPLIHAAGMAGAESALNYLLDMGIGLDWAIINQEALKWAQTYTYPLVKGINATTKAVLQTAVSDWINSGAPLDTLIEQLRPTFGPVRADMIGVTETTRSLANGNVIAWQESGVVDGYTVTTAVDELVCPICGVYAPGGEDFGKVFPLDDSEHIPPFHVRCRCGTKPEVKL